MANETRCEPCLTGNQCPACGSTPAPRVEAQPDADFERKLTPLIAKHGWGIEEVEDIRKLATSEPGWISVEKRLPDIVRRFGRNNCYGESKTLLIADSGRLVTGRMYESGVWDSEDGDILRDVTHWMELPDAPTEKGKP